MFQFPSNQFTPSGTIVYKVTANAHFIKVNRLIETEDTTEVKSDQLFHILNFIYNELFHINNILHRRYHWFLSFCLSLSVAGAAKPSLENPDNMILFLNVPCSNPCATTNLKKICAFSIVSSINFGQNLFPHNANCHGERQF